MAMLNNQMVHIIEKLWSHPKLHGFIQKLHGFSAGTTESVATWRLSCWASALFRNKSSINWFLNHQTINKQSSIAIKSSVYSYSMLLIYWRFSLVLAPLRGCQTYGSNCPSGDKQTIKSSSEWAASIMDMKTLHMVVFEMRCTPEWPFE